MTVHKSNILLSVMLLSLSIIFFSSTMSAKEPPFTVVIDAGHGGKDTGAIENNIKEKDVNLGIAQRLEEILKRKGIKVIMTRDGDKFVNLSDRPSKANKAKADLFISIHTNSLPESNANRKNVEGAQVYVLGLHRDADNLAVARRENAVISLEKNHQERYEGFDPNKDESYIIFEMAQKKTLANSIGFGQEVQKELVKTAGRRDRGVHQAGFLVLREAAMPAVLVEVDFICNPNSARYIGSSTGQKKLAQSIANAVMTYRNTLKKNAHAYEDNSIDSNSSDGVYVLVSDNGSSSRRSSAVRHSSQTVSYKSTNCDRRRRSASAKKMSENQNYEVAFINIKEENSNLLAAENVSKQVPVAAKESSVAKPSKNNKDNKSLKKSSKKSKKDDKKEEQDVRMVNGHKVVVTKPSKSAPRSLKSSKPTTTSDPEPEIARQAVANSFGNKNASSGSKRKEVTPVDKEVASAFDTASTNSNKESAVGRTRVKPTTSTNYNSSESSTNKKVQTQPAKKIADKDSKVKSQNVEENNRQYEAAKQKSINSYQASGAPKSLKSKRN